MNAFTEIGARQISAPAKARQRATEKRARKTEQKVLAERDTLHHGWKRWRHKRVEALLSGPHGSAARDLIAFLTDMTLSDASALLARVKQGPWRDSDADTRFEILSLVDAAIVRLRERADMEPIDDALPGQLPNGFLLLREWLR
jgi:hypothetical protein